MTGTSPVRHPASMGDPGESITSATLRRLQREIAAGTWELGTRIPTEAELVVLYQAGRSTIREAVSTLVHLGMLVPLRSRGTRVRSTTAIPTVMAEFTDGYTLEDLHRTQRAFEIDAARAAARHRTADDVLRLRAALKSTRHDCRHPYANRFHSLVFDIGRNALLADLNQGLELRIRAEELESPRRRPSERTVRSAHRALLEGIAAGDEDAAERAARRHARAR